VWNRASLMWRVIQVPSRGPNCHLSIVTSCKVILDSGFNAVDSELFQVLGARFLVRGTPIVRFQIP